MVRLPVSRRFASRVSALCIALGLASAALTALHLSPALDGAAAGAGSLFALWAILWVARHRRRAGRWPWLLLAGSQAAWLAGLIVQMAGSSLAGAPDIVGAALAAAGLAAVLVRREPGRLALLDVLAVALVTWMLVYQYLVDPYVVESRMIAGGDRATEVADLVVDVALFALAARLAVSPGRRSVSHTLLVGGVAALLAADVPLHWLTLTGTYSGSGWFTDAGWALSPWLLAAAAIHPSMPRALQPARGLDSARRWRHLALIAGALLIPSVMLLLDYGERDLDMTLTDMSSGVLLTLAVLARGVVVIRSWQRCAGEAARLRDLDRLKDAFVATVSHELRTPLTSIRGYVELLLEGDAGELTAEQRRFLAVVGRNSERLGRLVGDLLFIAQAERGQLSLQYGAADLCALVADAAQSARPLAAEKEIELLVETDQFPRLHADPARLGQVLDNLVSNALKFTPQGGRVEIRARRDGRRAAIEVRDSGPGISAADQERLFERFFRTQSAIDGAVPGTGLGLAIAKAIVEAHGGEIAVRSGEGAGTTFRVLLPLTLAETEQKEAA